MKNIRLFFILLIFIFMHASSVALAQSFQGFVLGGINASQVSGDELSGFNKAGVMFGGGVALPLNQSGKLNASMAILFIQKGSKTPTSKDGNNADYYKMSLNYTEVPLMITYKPSSKIGIHAGPTVGLLVSEKEEDIAGELTERPPFEKMELGIAGGLSFHVTENFSLNMRLSNSLLPIRKIGADTRYFISGQYNSGLAFFITYTFKTQNKTNN